MIYLMRVITKNFILKHRNDSLNGMPIESGPASEYIEQKNASTLEGYINNILMKMETDA